MCAENFGITTYGYIFLFKWKKELQNDGRIPLDPYDTPNLFFARQIATNACATQALLAVLLNSPDISLGDELNDFKSFTGPLDSESKGLAIGNFDKIRTSHNSFTRPDPFLVEQAPEHSKGGEDPYHFVAYVPFENHVYE
jgi:ubiquitin carboxyl-terminal hydrolase L5